MRQKNSLYILLSSVPRNLFSGLVVSLIALPLSLGLAMACDAPPIAGVITSIVGGVVLAVFGGSYVTVSGPGKGLVGVVLVAVSTLGLTTTYAAIICSGVLLLVLGFFRLGKLADYFPSSAIQGVLAAIGLIILGKQFHIMLANKISRDNTIEYLIAIPETIVTAINHQEKGLEYAALAGILSLLVMIFYSKVRNKYLQLIPAPMWIVISSIGFSYYCELVLGTSNPISEKYMIPNIPSLADTIKDIPIPDFGSINTVTFWSSVIALTLIASIESLLSIKAVDKLDPMKRRSNVNKDVKALGLATTLSGIFGGLNVVTVIAPSSVNISNGGSNRLGNFFHAIFLTLFILLFSSELTRIPLPALMAILVYTGYKLAAPKMLKQVFLVGKEQLIIFLSTLLVTLKIGLISGILAGLISTFLIHILVNKSLGLFIKNIVKPNVLMYKEENGNYFISVKHFCSFLNFNKLKGRLGVIPENNDVIIDFSMCAFVDHTVMENINDFQELFNKKGGNIEVLGLDMLGTKSAHPFALRRLIPVKNIVGSGRTKRQENIEVLAKDYNLCYNANGATKTNILEKFIYFKTKNIEKVANQLTNNKKGLCLLDVTYSEGLFIAKEIGRSTMLVIDLEKNLPSFSLDKEGFLEKLYSLGDYNDIDFSMHKDFSKRFYLRGEKEQEIRGLFNASLVQFFESNPYYHVECCGDLLLIFGKERLASIKEIKALMDFGYRLKETLNKN